MNKISNPFHEKLEKNLMVRRELAAGEPHDYTLNDQLFGWSGTRTALQSLGLDACVRDCAGLCGWNRASSDGLVDRPNGCHNGYMPADRLPHWNIRSSSSGVRLITQVVAPHLLRNTSKACRALASGAKVEGNRCDRGLCCSARGRSLRK